MKNRNVSWLGLLVATLGSVACGGERAAETKSAEPRAEIVQPQERDTVSGSAVPVRLAAHGVTVAPALGTRVRGEGHHHLFVDRDVTPPGDSIPKNVDGIIHLGTGASEFEVKNLSPGAHRIIAVLAWGDHVPMEGVATDTVHIHVKAP